MPCSTRLSSLIGSVSEKINNLLLDRVVCESGGWEVLCPSVVFFLKLLKMRNQENQRREKKRRISDRDRWLMSLDEERREQLESAAASLCFFELISRKIKRRRRRIGTNTRGSAELSVGSLAF